MVAGRPWGVWASLAWFGLIFVAEPPLYDAALGASGLGDLLERNAALHALNILVAWGLQFALIWLAVRLTRLPLRDYLGWVRPRLRYIAIGVPAILVLPLILIGVALLGGLSSSSPQIVDYHAAIAAGQSPWWAVLRYWPAMLLAPFVEESFFRGFLWRGLQPRLGQWGAWLGTSVLFVAVHYGYFLQGGEMSPVSLLDYCVTALILGWLRWQSRGTTVPMIVHGLSNLWTMSQVTILAALLR